MKILQDVNLPCPSNVLINFYILFSVYSFALTIKLEKTFTNEIPDN